MSGGAKAKILCVDDEPNVLDGLALHLSRTYEMVKATGGRAGLEALGKQGPFTVVLSDMRMPEMDGAVFLNLVRQASPDTTRMLLTGHADLETAIAAVNEGQIFRFLTKPCPPDQLRLAFQAAAEQYRLVTTERVLLEQTLHGAIQAMTDVLSLTSPVAFGKAARIRNHVRALATELRLANGWQVEVAAMLSQLGSIALPDETIRKQHHGEKLTAEERAMVERTPMITDGLLANIPRLEPVREMLTRLAARGKAAGNDSEPGDGKEEMSKAVSLLKIAVEYDDLESSGVAPQIAFDTMRGRQGSYDPEMLEVFLQLKGSAATTQVVEEIPLRLLQIGMVLAEDMRTQTGLLVVTRGFEVTQSFLEKTQNFRDNYVKEPLRVIVRRVV